MLIKIESAIAKFSNLLGKFTALLLIFLLFNVFYDVVMRYVFNDVSIAMQELEWHLYACIILLGVPYAMNNNGHVRVDFVYERCSPQRQAWINIFGTVFFLLPFALLVFWFGVPFVMDAYELGEGSGDPGGLPYRWIIKTAIPASFLFMAITGIGQILRSILIIQGHEYVVSKDWCGVKEHSK